MTMHVLQKTGSSPAEYVYVDQGFIAFTTDDAQAVRFSNLTEANKAAVLVGGVTAVDLQAPGAAWVLTETGISPVRYVALFSGFFGWTFNSAEALCFASRADALQFSPLLVQPVGAVQI